VFTASAWPEQVLFWSADYPHEAADSLVRHLPFVGSVTHSSTARLLVMFAAARRWRSSSTSEKPLDCWAVRLRRSPFEEEQVRREPAPQFPLEGVIGPGLMERRQELGDRDAADAVASAAGTVLEGAREEGLTHVDGTAEDDVLLLGTARGGGRDRS